MAYSRYTLSPELARRLALAWPRVLLGPELWSACEQNRLSDAIALATRSPHQPSDVWTAALEPATAGRALDAATHALEHGGEVEDRTL